jgi:hypothetical protein
MSSLKLVAAAAELAAQKDKLTAITRLVNDTCIEVVVIKG